MRKANLLGAILLLLIIIVLYVLVNNYAQNFSSVEYAQNFSSVEDDYTGSNFKGNYVYGGAMNLAWNELSENIVKDEIKLNTKDKDTLATMDKFNASVFTKKDLDEASYYVKSGYGQKTVTLINKESKEKFPSKSFGNLDITLGDFDIISYAYFLKEIEYQKRFKEKRVLFNGKSVKGFYAEDVEQKNNLVVLYYKDDDKFIIKIKLKDNNDELILAKGFNMNKPKDIVNKINKYNKDDLESIRNDDLFETPNLHLDYSRNYEEIIDIFFANKGFEQYAIDMMYENIKFDMDCKGARVENESVIPVWGSMQSDTKEIRKFILDKPFWVVIKRSNSQNPYFILGVNNIELMEK